MTWYVVLHPVCNRKQLCWAFAELSRSASVVLSLVHPVFSADVHFRPTNTIDAGLADGLQLSRSRVFVAGKGEDGTDCVSAVHSVHQASDPSCGREHTQ